VFDKRNGRRRLNRKIEISKIGKKEVAADLNEKKSDPKSKIPKSEITISENRKVTKACKRGAPIYEIPTKIENRNSEISRKYEISCIMQSPSPNGKSGNNGEDLTVAIESEDNGARSNG